MADDDDDEAAIEEGQEAPTDDTGAPMERVSTGGPITAVIPVKKSTRPISDSVRKVFADSMAKMKARGGDAEDEGGLEPVEHEALPGDAAPPEEAAAPPVETPAPPPIAPPPPQPPAPSLDPEVMRMRSELDQQRKDLEAERAKVTESARTTDIAKLRDTYFDKGAPAVAEIIKQWMPGLSDDEMKNEIADLIQDLAHQFLETPLEQSVKDRIATKRTRAGLKAWRSEQDRIAEDQQKRLTASQEEENRRNVKRILHQEVTKPDHASQYPWLAVEDNAGDIVFETIDTEYQKSGTQLTWMEAAKRADEWLKQQRLAFYDKRKHLLSPQPPTPQQTAPGEKQRSQGDNQVSRSQAPPKKPTPPPVQERPVVNGKWSPEAHREAVKKKFRGQLQALSDED